MTKKAFAQKLAEELKRDPSPQNVDWIIKRILDAKITGRITESDIHDIYDFIEAEIGTLCILEEGYDNSAQITVMQQMHQLINQANQAGNGLYTQSMPSWPSDIKYNIGDGVDERRNR